MPELALPLPFLRRHWLAAPLILLGLLFVVAISAPNFLRVSHSYKMVAPLGAPGSTSAELTMSDVTTDALFSSEHQALHEFDRKMVRSGTLDLEVKSPAEATESVRLLAERLGGYLVSSQISGSQDMPTAAITIRVPVGRFEEARSEIKKLATRVETEKTDATDVTRDYVDKDARLRNLRASETQYLAIMKRATTVKDTLAVSEKLSEVRGEIEQQQAEFDALSKRIETVAINVSLRAQADTHVFGLHWRPWYQLKLAMRDGLDGLGDYAATMAAVILYLPTILLWIATVVIGAVVAWRLLRWVGRMFAFPKAVPAEKVS